MDEITVDDIIGSFPVDNNEREKRLEGVEELYRSEHNVLHYYNLVNPELYYSELKAGTVIRYSSRVSHLSCASRVIKVYLNADKTIGQLKLVAINKGNNSEIWEIYPELYYIFKYNPTITKLRREFYKAGLTTEEEFNDPNNPIRRMVERKEDRKKQTKRTLKAVDNIVKNDGNRLNIETLVRADPSLADKIIRSNNHQRHTNDIDDEEEIYRTINRTQSRSRHKKRMEEEYKYKPQMLSLLEDSDEDSDKEYIEDLGFVPDPELFDKLQPTKRTRAEKNPQSKSRSNSNSNSKSKSEKKKNWNVSVTPRRTTDLMNKIKQIKKNSKTGKVMMTDDLTDLL